MIKLTDVSRFFGSKKELSEMLDVSPAHLHALEQAGNVYVDEGGDVIRMKVVGQLPGEHTICSMKDVEKIVMADNKRIERIDTDGRIEAVLNIDKGECDIYHCKGKKHIFLTSDVKDYAEVEEFVLDTAIDSETPVTGQGRYAGRKFWQLPRRLQQEVLNYVRK